MILYMVSCWIAREEEKTAIADYVIVVKNGGIFFKPRGIEWKTPEGEELTLAKENTLVLY